MKSGIRIVAIDDSKFSPGEKEVLVVGVVERLGIVEGVLSCRVEADGTDATAKIIGMLSDSRFLEQIRLIVINGTTVAGMNVVDITRLHSRFKMPVMAVTRKRPHPAMLKRSIKTVKSRGYLKKLETIDRISNAAEMDRSGGFYVQHIGIEKGAVSKYIKNASESLRLAHMIASGVVRGESRGRL